MHRLCKLIALLGLTISGGCAAEVSEPAAVQRTEGAFTHFGERPCPEDSPLTYETFGEPFLRDWCTGCHAQGLAGPDARALAPQPVNLDHPDSVRLNIELLWIVAADDNRSMPPVGGPSPEERALFGEWLACGAP